MSFYLLVSRRRKGVGYSCSLKRKAEKRTQAANQLKYRGDTGGVSHVCLREWINSNRATRRT